MFSFASALILSFILIKHVSLMSGFELIPEPCDLSAFYVCGGPSSIPTGSFCTEVRCVYSKLISCSNTELAQVEMTSEHLKEKIRQYYEVCGGKSNSTG